MTFHRFSLLSFALVLFLSLGSVSVAAESGKSSMGDVKKEASELLDAMKRYTAEQRDEAAQATKGALERLDAQIAALEKQIAEQYDKMDKAAREQAQENLQQLRALRIKVAEWYGSLKSSSKEGWDNVKEGFSGAFKALQDAWEKTHTDMKDDDKTSL